MAGANPQLLSGGHFEAEWRVKIKNYISNTSVLRGLDHFITSPDTPVCWIFCVNIWYFRFQFSLDRPIPIQIILLIIFPVRCKKYFKKENWLELRRFSAFGTRHATACLRHYAERALTPRSLNVKLGPRRNYHKGRAAIRHYANQTARPLWPWETVGSMPV